ncbi:hypothetical protein AB0C27_40690 [Nonomuraea sp. NPDC048882]|uniref:hypothetical protein n=1 Tax=Nonomuraea sp. NPDC048882 TaxID=3154347 RepID=UPI0033D93EED
MTRLRRGICPSCRRSYARVRSTGAMRRHNGIDSSGFSTGKPCPGVGKPPLPSVGGGPDIGYEADRAYYLDERNDT